MNNLSESLLQQHRSRQSSNLSQTVSEVRLPRELPQLRNQGVWMPSYMKDSNQSNLADVWQLQDNILGLLKTKSLRVPVNDDDFMRQTLAIVKDNNKSTDLKELQAFIRVFLDEVSKVEENFITLILHSEQEYWNLKDKIEKKLKNIYSGGK